MNHYVNNLGIYLCGSSNKPTEQQCVLQKLPVWHLVVSSASQQGWHLGLTYPCSAGCIIGLPAELAHTHASSLTADGKLINCLLEAAGLRQPGHWCGPITQPLTVMNQRSFPAAFLPLLAALAQGERVLQSAWFLYVVHPIQTHFWETSEKISHCQLLR